MAMYWFLLLAFLGLTASVRREELYPFGEEQGDQRLPIGDDENSPEFQLDTPIAFYDYRYRSIYINTNGALSFEREYPSYGGGLYFPVGVKLIAPFLADVDTRLSGNVFYRETADPSLLDLASQDIQSNFPNMFQFRASHLLVVTWHEVGYYRQQYDRTNTFQAVVASDGFDSFAFFLYQDGGVQWVLGEGKDAPQRQDIPAQAGFDSGDLVRYHTLPGSGNYEVDQIALTSNMGAPGKWVFHIGLVDDYIGEPNSHVTEDNTVAVHPESCAAGGASQCHANAACQDEFGGFCCQCLPPSYGNGITCMEPGSALRVNGKVSGTVNGYAIESQDLHAYVVTKDGRSYTAISRLPLELGVAMQAAYPVGSLIGWLFAASPSPNVKNGAMLTGGNLNRTAVLRYVPGGQTLQISQTFVNEGTQGALSVTTTLNGEVPELLPGTEVQLDDYVEDYNKESPGVLRSSSQQTYLVGGLPHRFMLDQTIRYQEPCSEGITASSEGIRLEVVRPYIVYGEEEEIVRYAMTNRVTRGGSGGGYDPCQGTTECDVNAACSSQGDQYTCDCQPGYQGDGYICTDVDECVRGDHGCDVNAQCYNREGSFECRCLPGYRGDGRTCQQAESCNVLNNCDYNARCLWGPGGGYLCECNPGFYGDGYRCEPEGPRPGENTCEVPEDCHRDATCTYNQDYGTYNCQCNPGFSGDGYYCEEEDCNANNFCDINAQCIYETYAQRYTCRCNIGYEGDGRYCRQEAVGDSATYLVYAQGMTIMEIPFQPTDEARGQRLLDLPGQTAIGIDVDCYTRNVYWTDVSGKTISRAALDGSEQRVLVENLGSPEGVAVDWIAKNMYWTDSSLDRIEVAQLDGTHRTTLFDTDLINPRAIILDSGNGLMFWSDWDRDSPKIESAYMDGTKRQLVVGENLGLPNGLALDHSAQQLCWADAGTQHLECVNYDGRGRRVVYAFASYPFDLVFANDIFYWTDWDMNSLPNIDKYGGDTNEPLILPEGGNGRLYGIAAVRETCPRVTNACALNNGGCRFLCLPTPNGGRTCLCPGDIPEEECNEIGLVV